MNAPLARTGSGCGLVDREAHERVLGYSLLMQYADKLTTDDLRSLEIGQVVAGAFYSRPAWLSGKVRGVDAKLWGEAVAALNEAARLNPGLALVQANLGVAYLLRPTGKDTPRAIAHLEQASSMLKTDASLAAQLKADPRTPLLAVANNLAVAYAAAGRVNNAGELITSVAAWNAVDPKWEAAIPYTLIVKPGGEVLYRHLGAIDPLEVKKVIVGYVGRTYK